MVRVTSRLRPAVLLLEVRTALVSLSLLAATAGAGVLAGCEGMEVPTGIVDAQEKKHDSQAQLEFYEENAQTAYDHGQYLQSVMQWRHVLEVEPTRQKARWGLAKSLSMVGTPESLREAEGIFKEIIDLDWSHPTLGDRKHEVLRDFAEVYASLADLYDQDIRSLERKLEQPDADSTTLRQQIQTQTSTRDELLKKAIPLYQQVLERSKDNVYAIGGLAKSYLMLGGRENDRIGTEYARRSIALSQQSQKLWAQKLDSWKKDAGNEVTEEQRKFFTDHVRGARDKELKLRILLATVLYRDRDFVASAAEYDKVIEMDPTIPAAYVERAQAEAMTNRPGDLDRAIADLEYYLKITDPVSQRAARIQAAELLQKYRMGRSAGAGR